MLNEGLMAAAVAKSRPQPAEAHVEWWSPQQALTMILTGDEAAADAAAIQNFADFEKEMKRRELAAWIGQAIDELYGAIRGAPLIECEGHRIDGEEAQCSLRGRRLSENEIRSIVADEIHDPDRSAAWRLVLRGDEIVLGANGHIEWRSLEFERAGVLRAAKWARRESSLRQRIRAIEHASTKPCLMLLDAIHLIMHHLHPEGWEFAAAQDRAPSIMPDVPPLWFVLQRGGTAAARAIWTQANGVRCQAYETLFSWLREGSLRSYGKGQPAGVIPYGVWVGSEEFVDIYSSRIPVGNGSYVKVHVLSSELIKSLRHPSVRKLRLENSNETIYRVTEYMMRQDADVPASAIAAALRISPRSRPLDRAMKIARAKLNGDPVGKRGRRPLKNIMY